MLARRRRVILIASATAAVIGAAFAAVSANSESSQKAGLVQSVGLPESTSVQEPQSSTVQTAEPQSSMVPTAVVAEPRAPARKADIRRRFVHNAPPAPATRAPLILGIRH
jgi:hypothetical protein